VGSGALHVRLHDPDDRPLAKHVLSAALGVPTYLESDPTTVTARSAEAGEVGAALTELSRAGIAVAELSLGQPSLDEVFLALTGHPAELDRADDDEEEAA
jgi:ABC-2 type transport system ATP-binding protein